MSWSCDSLALTHDECQKWSSYRRSDCIQKHNMSRERIKIFIYKQLWFLHCRIYVIYAQLSVHFSCSNTLAGHVNVALPSRHSCSRWTVHTFIYGTSSWNVTVPGLAVPQTAATFSRQHTTINNLHKIVIDGRGAKNATLCHSICSLNCCSSMYLYINSREPKNATPFI